VKNVNKSQLKGVPGNDFIAHNFSDGNIILKLRRQLSLACRCGFWVVVVSLHLIEIVLHTFMVLGGFGKDF
jgi:hypothetical protein